MAATGLLLVDQGTGSDILAAIGAAPVLLQQIMTQRKRETGDT